MKNVRHGGPAFPMPSEICKHVIKSIEETFPDGEKRSDAFDAFGQFAAGMTLRDYFMAHAPAEPQHWFEPAMPTIRPQHVHRPKDLTEKEREEINGFQDCLSLEDLKEPRAIEYCRTSTEAQKAMQDWDRERNKKLWTQWPAAWADEQLKAREA